MSTKPDIIPRYGMTTNFGLDCLCVLHMEISNNIIAYYFLLTIGNNKFIILFVICG